MRIFAICQCYRSVGLSCRNSCHYQYVLFNLKMGGPSHRIGMKSEQKPINEYHRRISVETRNTNTSKNS